MTFLAFVLEHAAALALILLVAAAAGTGVAGPRMPLSLRAALGLAVAGQVFCILGAVGSLRPPGISVFVVLALLGGGVRSGRDWWRGVAWKHVAWIVVAVLPLLLLALHPPLAFDETLYHLPFVRWMARTGWLTWRPDVRFPLFPELHEALCVPLFLALGDAATHLVALAETLILVALLVEWPRPAQRLAGFLAAAVVLGSPIVVHMATITYVDPALALFIAAGFRCLDGWDDAQGRHAYPGVAGFLFGTACCVKYHGWYFAVGGLAFLLLFGRNRWRAVPRFLLMLIGAVLPTYGLLVFITGNPFFPFFAKLFGESPWQASLPDRQLSVATRVIDALRIFWDATFARQRLNGQPPYSPLFAAAFLVTLAAAFRSRRALYLSILCAGFLLTFTYLPQDSRYLLPLLPLLSIAAATAFASWLGTRPSARTIMIGACLAAVAPGVAYAGYRLAKLGLPPATADQRRLALERRIPEYRALERRGDGAIYVCGAEQLKYYGGEELLGDVMGPYAEQHFFGPGGNTERLARLSDRLRIRYVLISRAICPREWPRVLSGPRFERVYADADAELWRVLPWLTDSR